MKKLYKTLTSTDTKLVAKVYKDADYGEFVVKFYRDGVHQQYADYHTDRCDALGTAQRFIEGRDCGTCGGHPIGQNQPSPVEVIDAARARLAGIPAPAPIGLMTEADWAAHDAAAFWLPA